MLVNYSCSTSQTLHTTEVITHTQGDCADTHWGRMSDNLSWWKEVQFGGGGGDLFHTRSVCEIFWPMSSFFEVLRSLIAIEGTIV